MRTLTSQEIEQFASYPKVKKIAVENFLATMGTDSSAAFGNLDLDLRLYNWNVATYCAIRAGIKAALQSCPSKLTVEEGK